MLQTNSSRTTGAAIIIMTAVLLLTSVFTPHAQAASKFKTLHGFKGGKDGSRSFGGLVFDAQGNLYGTTNQGGAKGYGTVFRLSPNENSGWTESVLHFFNGTDGAFPYAGVTLDSAGNLYGTTPAGGAHGVGTVFQLIPNGDGTWTENVMHSFQKDGNDGYTPYASPIFDQSGNLYGTTFAGGVNNDGTVFELSPNGNGGWKESILHTFSGADGELPIAGLIFDVTGNLYGTTYGGGGTVFKLVPNGGGAWTESVLYTFTGRDGKQPFAGVSFDAAGNLYGTTFYGGAFGWGAIFKLAPTKDGSWRESVVWSFSQEGKDGDLVNAGLTLDAVGNLYGETNVGGKYGWGVAFRLTPANGGWEETILHAFKDHPGAEPVAGMIFDANGDLYGTTAGDGGSVLGSVFEISP